MFQILPREGDATKAQLSVVGSDLDREKIDTITLRIVVNDTKTEDGAFTDYGKFRTE